MKLSFKKHIKSSELTVFTRQLATLLSAGIPLIQGLTIIIVSTKNKSFVKVLQQLKKKVESGLSFSAALKRHSNVFDTLYCSLCEAGEQSGTLDILLDRIALYREKKDLIIKKINTALYYPAAVFIIAWIVSIILLVKVVPTFKDMFKGFNAPLPYFTLMIIHISDMVKHYGGYFIGGFFIIFIFLFRLYKKNNLVKAKSHLLFLKLPIFGQLIQKAILARFARTLATLFAAGIPLMESLDALGKTSTNVIYQKAIQQSRSSLTHGHSLHNAMKQTLFFPAMVIQMVNVGEESGTLEAMLNKIAELYEAEVEASLNGLSTLLEPVIMVFLGLIVGSLVIALYLPIFELGSLV